MAELVFFRRSEELMRVALDGSPTMVGRGPNNDILVPDPAISRKQFSVEKKGEQWILRDQSGRGTEVLGNRVTETELCDGFDIGLSQWRAVFYLTSGRGYGGETTRQQLKDEEDTLLQPCRHEKEGIPQAFIHVGESSKHRVVSFFQEAIIGSSDRCDVKLDDPFVSSRHARIERRNGGFALCDLQSKNGVFIGPVRVYEAEIPVGCIIRIGNTDISLRLQNKSLSPARFEGMVGNDSSMRRLYETVERVAPSTAAVAIFGESGTGKELVARAVHARSARAGKAFVPVNCGALSKELVESELFGHEKGAFTGAERMHKGAFEEADGGTLFLDEIGELPLALQAKLLRALELGEIKRVGSSKPMHVDVRVVAATNKDLRAEVKRGTFREDLYWRLCVVPMQLPPLRARKSDLRVLIYHFLHLYSPLHTAVSLSPEAEETFMSHNWPGNVRELKNTVHRSLLLRKGETIEASDILFDREKEAVRAAEGEAFYDPHVDDLERIFIPGKTMETIDDEFFLKTCRRVGTRVSKVAEAIGQSRGAVYRRMERLGIVPSGGDPQVKGEA